MHDPNSIENRLRRIETRLCKLMEALKVDPHEDDEPPRARAPQHQQTPSLTTKANHGYNNRNFD